VFTFLRYCFTKVACTEKVELLAANGERNDLCAVNDLRKFSVHLGALSDMQAKLFVLLLPCIATSIFENTH